VLDISGFNTSRRATQGVRMVICRPGTTVPLKDKDGREAAIILRGRNGSQFREKERELQERAATRRTVGVAATAEELAQERIEYLIACTAGLENLSSGGTPLTGTPEEIAALWGDLGHDWLHTQAERFILSDANFLASELPASSGGPSTSSG